MTSLSAAQKLLANKKAAIFTTAGQLVWRSAAWSNSGSFTPAQNQRLLGTGWHEFIDLEDLAPLLAWLISPQYHAPITVHCMSPASARHLWCLWRKAPLDANHWLILGDSTPVKPD